MPPRPPALAIRGWASSLTLPPSTGPCPWSSAALESVTRGLALEYAADGVRVNSVAPGVVQVERTEALLGTPEAKAQAHELWTPHLPAGRMGTTAEVAEVVLSMVCNEWVNGAVWTVDGGMMARANMPIRPRPGKVGVEKKRSDEGGVEPIVWDALEDLKPT